MKVPLVFFALHSAGVLSYLLSTTATWVSATSPGHTREYFASAAVPPPSSVEVVGTSTRLLTGRRLNPSSPYAIPQRRVFPWHASYYNGKPELHYSNSYTPIIQDSQDVLGPYALSTRGGREEAGSKASSVLRSAEEINELPHDQLPVWALLNGPVFSDGRPLPKFSQGLPDSGSLNNLLTEPLFHSLRFMREEKDEDAPEGENEVKEVHVDRRSTSDDAEVEKKKKKKKKMQWAQEEREGPWEEDESEGEQGVKEKVQHEKKHDSKSERERKSRQYEEIGREEKQKAAEGGAGEPAGVEESERQPAGDAKERKKSGKDVQEAPPAVAVHEEKQEEKKLRSSSPSSHAPEASYKNDYPAVEEKQRPQPEQPKQACAGVCHVYAKTGRWEDVDSRTKSEKSEDLKSSPSMEPVSAVEPKAGASYKKDDAKGKKGTYLGEVGGQEEAELRVKRSPDTFHRQRIEKEMLKDPSGNVRRMMFWPRRYVYYHLPHDYTYLAPPRAYWSPGYYFTSPRDDDDDYYPIVYYRRWLREDASDSEKPNNRSSHMPTGQAFSERTGRNHGVECAPGSSCSISPSHTYRLTPTSDDVRLLQHAHSTADASHLNSDKEYLIPTY